MEASIKESSSENLLWVRGKLDVLVSTGCRDTYFGAMFDSTLQFLPFKSIPAFQTSGVFSQND